MSQGIQTNGSCLAISAIVAATKDQAGYEALTFTDSNEVTSFGSVGPTNNVIKYDTVCDGLVNKRMGTTDNGNMQATIAWDTKNGAQIIFWAKVHDKTKFSVRITLSSGDVIYFDAYVSSMPVDLGGSGDIIRSGINLEVDSPLTLVGRP